MYERERETVFHLLPKVALIQQLSFSSSRMFPNAATFCVFRVGSAKGSFQTTTCSRNSRKQPFFFRREVREAAEVMTELGFEDKKGMASPHLARPSALLKGYGSRALPDPALGGSQLPPSLSPNFPSPASSPHPCIWDTAKHSGPHFTPCLPAGEEESGLFTSCEAQRRDVNHFPHCRISPRGHGVWREPMPAPLAVTPQGLGTAVTCWLAKVAHTHLRL